MVRIKKWRRIRSSACLEDRRKEEEEEETNQRKKRKRNEKYAKRLRVVPLLVTNSLSFFFFSNSFRICFFYSRIIPRSAVKPRARDYACAHSRSGASWKKRVGKATRGTAYGRVRTGNSSWAVAKKTVVMKSKRGEGMKRKRERCKIAIESTEARR